VPWPTAIRQITRYWEIGEVAASGSSSKGSEWFAPSSTADLRTPRRLRVSCMRKNPVSVLLTVIFHGKDPAPVRRTGANCGQLSVGCPWWWAAATLGREEGQEQDFVAQEAFVL
jgi:hypothetical protein